MGTWSRSLPMGGQSVGLVGMECGKNPDLLLSWDRNNNASIIGLGASLLKMDSKDRLFKVSAYDYDLPTDLIAQNPVTPRDSANMLVLSRKNGSINHRIFHEIPEYLTEGDVLVRNNTRVMAARLRGKKAGGSADAEILILSKIHENVWEAMVRPGRRLKPGTSVVLTDGTTVLIEGYKEEGLRSVEFPKGVDVPSLLDKVGTVPLPPYITSSTAPSESYQTVFSKETTSAAAPTAGLHFTETLLSKIRAKGIDIADVTLDVGLGTFRPVKEADLREHPMHVEKCRISEEDAMTINKAKKDGRRIIAVGTTSVRTLESMARNGIVVPGEIATSLFIYPGYSFQIVDAMITNFHLPKSTLLMLVSAFAGHNSVMNAYKEAVLRRYRFFSFGDAMFIH